MSEPYNGVPIPDGALTADGFDDAVIGFLITAVASKVVYSYDQCVAVLMRDQGMDRLTAIEWMDFNVVGSSVGPNTPIFLSEDEMSSMRLL